MNTVSEIPRCQFAQGNVLGGLSEGKNNDDDAMIAVRDVSFSSPGSLWAKIAKGLLAFRSSFSYNGGSLYAKTP